MIDWDKITDEELREAVLGDLRDRVSVFVRQAERKERDARRPDRAGDRRESEACARYSRRQAAHFQQAIDLLAAAPMPPKDEPR
jgi:hypothetical protein